MSKKMTISELREIYLRYFESKGHSRISSSGLVPEHDPTTLFIGSGMQPLVPYLLGEEHPKGSRLVNAQLCFRAEDIDEVGDNRHTTFFEMLGNWSFGDYFKKEQLTWIWNLLVDELGINPERLYVTVFSGDKERNIPRDNESSRIWRDLFKSKGVSNKEVFLGNELIGAQNGMQGGRIFYYDATKNWWSRAGIPSNMPAGEPGGPDSELFFDFGTDHDPNYGDQCHPNCDCGRFMEIGNSVFMEYLKLSDGSFASLPRRNVDFGGGLERLCAAINNEADVFLVDTLWSIIQAIDEVATKSYELEYLESYRIVADHIRGAVFMMAHGVSVSNTDQGYVVRRLLRRAVRHLDVLGAPKEFIDKLVGLVIDNYKATYPFLVGQKYDIEKGIQEEESKFRQTLDRGLREFERFEGKALSGDDAFHLFSTFGFPLELTLDLAAERGMVVDTAGFEKALADHQALSREGAKGKFAGGLADHSEMSIKYHTATHMLQQALRDVLGNHVIQRGSNITPKRLRFDFSHTSKLTDDERRRVEDLVNQKIAEDLTVIRSEMTVVEAKDAGALGLFEEKYGERVGVYTIGDWSIEICGGPHVDRTGVMGVFSIVKEESASAGVRRIKAVLN